MLVFLVLTRAVICPTGVKPVHRSIAVPPSYTDYLPPAAVEVCGQRFWTEQPASVSACVAGGADQGPFEIWHGTKPWIEGYCDGGRLHGPWRELRSDGTPHASGRYDHGRRDGEWVEEGSFPGWTMVTHYRRGLKLDWSTFDAAGRRREDHLDDRSRYFDEQGHLESEEFSCPSEKPCPPSRSWYPDGTLHTLLERDGKQTRWTSFHPNGRKQEQKQTPDGEELSWYEDGRMKFRFLLRHGRREGHGTYWSPDGVAHEREYRDDVEIRP
jgi:antitoxin component YwqK of YwqJK toxin-antitoxin module